MKNEGSGERRLAAILAAGAVGYSKMMGADEVGTLRNAMPLGLGRSLHWLVGDVEEAGQPPAHS